MNLAFGWDQGSTYDLRNRHPEPSSMLLGTIWDHLEPSGTMWNYLVPSGTVQSGIGGPPDPIHNNNVKHVFWVCVAPRRLIS